MEPTRRIPEKEKYKWWKDHPDLDEIVISLCKKEDAEWSSIRSSSRDYQLSYGARVLLNGEEVFNMELLKQAPKNWKRSEIRPSFSLYTSNSTSSSSNSSEEKGSNDGNSFIVGVSGLDVEQEE